MTHFVAEIAYTAAPEVVAASRPAHREHLAALHARGALVLSGPWADGTGACLVYRADDEAAVRGMLADDPFLRDGVVEVLSVREWTVVVGG
ncbi:YciI family protein [Pseudokineococcus marinus]|uniref:YCII-related domain-containing protein n=1 Tax=Pseudokineococcus marinus TaxID=351215 RepID=A0A849BP28_9ACTN|nr:YciI family protein [Pseudokineococcus marinus]NNH22797.1 hypothetical protein [Pseudokineococcus marinus]